MDELLYIVKQVSGKTWILIEEHIFFYFSEICEFV